MLKRVVLVPLLLLSGCATLGSLWPFGSPPPPDLATEPPEQLYNEGIDLMQKGAYTKAVAHFEAVQQNYPYSPWATNAELMEGYTEYKRNQYTEAVEQLDRYTQLHPADKDTAYAYYLRSLCYYEQISDISRDQHGTQEALDALQEVVTRYPDSAYARDARLKIDLCRDHLAGKEMDVGRYYERQHYYAAAIGRFQRVIDLYQTTNHTPEALSRLTEIYLKLGLTDEAKRTAAVLAYNYPGSPWYQSSWNTLVDAKVVQGQTVAAPIPNKPGLVGRSLNWIF